MKNETADIQVSQQIFQSMMFGILLYAVILGFFNDYTSIIDTKSYSTTFAVAIIMQLLTYYTFALKKWVVRYHQKNNAEKFVIAFSVWLIMFISKFVFLGVLDRIFGENLNVSGFVGILLVILTFTLLQKMVETVYSKLER